MTKQEAILSIMDMGAKYLKTLTGLKTNEEIITMLNDKLNIIDQIDVNECKCFLDVWQKIEEEQENIKPSKPKEKNMMLPVMVLYEVNPDGTHAKFQNGILCF